MSGINEFKLNASTMQDIVQHHFETHMFKAGFVPRVQSVKAEGDSFVIKTSGLVADEDVKTDGADPKLMDL